MDQNSWRRVMPLAASGITPPVRVGGKRREKTDGFWCTILRIRSKTGKRKAFSTCSSHLTVVFIFYGSFIFIYLVPTSSKVYNLDKLFTIIFAFINPSLNPLIYSLRNQDLMEALASTILRIRNKTGKRKAFSTCTSHLTVVFIFYGSLIFIYLVPSSSDMFNLNKMFTVISALINPLLNPLIYSLRNKDLMEALMRFIFRTILRIRSKTVKMKTFSTCTSNLTVVFIFYGSLIFIYLVPTSSDMISLNKLFTVISALINPLLNPLIYSLRNKDLMETLLRIRNKTGKRKAFSTCTSHLTVVFIFYGFVFTWFPLLEICPVYTNCLQSCVPLFNPLLNPLIYSLRNNDLMEALMRSFYQLIQVCF
ncbi:olfactory receptor 3A1-like [Rana temporaria]|uniref:olfactory receptor 3A1-like n=1 Tax=Rana temporaria TaxID=8407 RepID=UPI001AAD9886|nr:olfactory receptor 3A1-like [Rana temporaria]